MFVEAINSSEFYSSAYTYVCTTRDGGTRESFEYHFFSLFFFWSFFRVRNRVQAQIRHRYDSVFALFTDALNVTRPQYVCKHRGFYAPARNHNNMGSITTARADRRCSHFFFFLTSSREPNFFGTAQERWSKWEAGIRRDGVPLRF